MPELSILITARNEEWLPQTVADVLAHMEADTEIIVVLDGYESSKLPTLAPHPRLSVLRHDAGLGQRAAINEAARMSSAPYIMKLDAHCAVDQGFDVKLLAAMAGHDDWTMIPQQRNFWVFSWRCQSCGKDTYMGPYPQRCDPVDDGGRRIHGHQCAGTQFERVLVWKPRPGTRTDFWIFDHTLHFQYPHGWKGKRRTDGDLADTMTCIGACWLMARERYWHLGGLDETHGSWGQMGTELACKTWLSGGRMVTHRGVWFAHMFRTRESEGFGFPYKNSGSARLRAQEYSRDLWLNDRWPGQVLPLAWLINKFKPLHGTAHVDEQGHTKGYHNWHDDVPECKAALAHIRQSERRFYETHERLDKKAVYA